MPCLYGDVSQTALEAEGWIGEKFVERGVTKAENRA
jgi:hypothetical protein